MLSYILTMLSMVFHRGIKEGSNAERPYQIVVLCSLYVKIFCNIYYFQSQYEPQIKHFTISIYISVSRSLLDCVYEVSTSTCIVQCSQWI